MNFARLGDHTKFLSGFAFKSKFFNDDRIGLPVVRIRDVMRGYSATFYSGEYDERYIVSCGEYLIGMDGEFNLARWQSERALLNQRVCKIDEISEDVDRDYLSKFLPMALKEIEDATPFVTVKHLSVKALNDIQIPLPPLAEQKRIAAVLDAADALRAKRRESLAQLDTLLESTFLDMFGDPVTNPMGWKVVKFEGVGESRLGKMLDKGKQAGDCMFPYLANLNVQWGQFELDELREMDFNEADRKEFELVNGDLLVCEGGEIGRTAIWREELEGVYFQKALHRVRLDPGKSVPEYIQYYMLFMAEHGGFSNFTNSATIAHLTGVKLKKLPLPLPGINLQHRFAAIVESVERQKANQRAHLDELDTLFASLQSRAFRGDL
jgi:type I restriction enzyme, S subunit